MGCLEVSGPALVLHNPAASLVTPSLSLCNRLHLGFPHLENGQKGGSHLPGVCEAEQDHGQESLADSVPLARGEGHSTHWELGLTRDAVSDRTAFFQSLAAYLRAASRAR